MTQSGLIDRVVASSPSLAHSQTRIAIRRVDGANPTRADIAAWLDLEGRALEGNAYMSPHFVVPAVRHLGDDKKTTLVMVEEHGASGKVLQAVAVLQEVSPDRTIPLPHRRAFMSVHSFLSGVLVARDGAKRHLQALCDAVDGRHGHGLVMESCRVDGPVDDLLREIALERGMRRCESYRYERAIMVPSEMGEAYLTGPLSSRNKKLRSQRNKLAKQGEVRFEVLRGKAIDEAVIERHLALEHMGWKGESGTSMRSNPAHEAFFREMASGFAADDRALFAQLSVGDQVIASTSNFIAGNTGFAFKIGFDPAFSQFGPGNMCELEFLRCAPEVAGNLDYVDSGSVAGSYLEAMWPHRRAIATVAYSTSLVGNVAMACNTQLRRIKQMVAKRKAGTSVEATAPAAQQATGE